MLADSSNEGVGGWSSEAVGTGQVSTNFSGNPYGIDGSGDARTSQATGSEPKRRAFVGTLAPTRATREGTGTFVEISFIDSISVTLQTSGGGEQVIGLPPAGGEVNVHADGTAECDICRLPGGPRRAGTLTGDADVVVLAEQTGENVWQAIWILVKPVKPPETTTGLVVEVEGDEVTVETSDGEKKTVTLPEHARGVANGELITVFRGNSGEAKGLVRAADVKTRLKNFLDHAEDDVDETEGDEEIKGNKHDKAERIANFLERFNARHTSLLDRVMDRATERVKAKLEQVRARIQAQRAEHQEAIERIRTKLDRVHPDNSDRGRPEDAGQSRPENADPDPDGEPSTADDGRGRGLGRGQGDGSDTP